MEGSSSSSKKFNSIGVFCGPSIGLGNEYMDAANNLGALLAARGINLVYGGGNMGLLACVATAATLGGCTPLGIIPKAFAAKKFYGVTLGTELQVISLHEKMANLMNNTDAFIALPGGLGTLEEIFNTASWAQLCLHHKPLGLLNVNGFYDGLLSFLDHAVEQQFMKPSARRIFISAPTAEQLIEKLLAYVPEPDPLMHEFASSVQDSRKRKERDSGLDLTLHL